MDLLVLQDVGEVGPEFGEQSAFASEGVVRWPELTADGRAIPKPAFAALRRLAATAP